jgi:hypothetical protein
MAMQPHQSMRLQLFASLLAGVLLLSWASGCIQQTKGTWEGTLVHTPVWDANGNEYQAVALVVSRGPNGKAPGFKYKDGSPVPPEDVPPLEPPLLIDSKRVLLNPEIYRQGTQVKVTGTLAQFTDITLDGKIAVHRQKTNRAQPLSATLRVDRKIRLLKSE